MPKHDLDPRDAHTFRVYVRHAGTDMDTHQEDIPLNHLVENDIVDFTDNTHAAVLTLARASVLEIQRLRTHALLAVSHDELATITRVLRGESDRVLAEAQDSGAVQEGKALAFLADSLERLNPVAATRAAEDPSSLPRTTPACTCQVTEAEGRWTTVMNWSCPVHRTTSNLVPADR